MRTTVTYRVGKGPVRPLRPKTSRLGLVIDALASVVWGLLFMGVLLAPYLALKPATNYWWLP